MRCLSPVYIVPCVLSVGLETSSHSVVGCVQERSERETCVTYEDSTSNLDEDATVCVAGHGIDGRDLVFYSLEGQTLKGNK